LREIQTTIDRGMRVGMMEFYNIRDDGIFQNLSIKDDGKYVEVFSVIQDV